MINKTPKVTWGLFFGFYFDFALFYPYGYVAVLVGAVDFTAKTFKKFQG